MCTIVNPPTPPAVPPVTPPANDKTPPAAPPAPSELEQKLEKAKGNPELQQQLLADLAAELKTTRYESMTRRQKLEEYETAETRRQDEAKKKESEGLSELERTKAENQDLADKLKLAERDKAAALAKADFVGAKPIDIADVLLRWNALTPEEQAKTTPSAWVEQLKKDKAHLFQAEGGPGPRGPNPRGDGRPGSTTAPPVITTHPKTRKEANEVRQAFRSRFHN